MSPRHDYAAILQARARQAADDAAGLAPLSLTQYRARCDLDRWRERRIAAREPVRRAWWRRLFRRVTGAAP